MGHWPFKTRVDYRALLGKYIKHVADQDEGSTFLSGSNWTTDPANADHSSVKFSDDEWGELKRIAGEP
jgi:hypothetical protein